jgi:hypothetical protein
VRELQPPFSSRSWERVTEIGDSGLDKRQLLSESGHCHSVPVARSAHPTHLAQAKELKNQSMSFSALVNQSDK